MEGEKNVMIQARLGLGLMCVFLGGREKEDDVRN